MLTQEAPRPLLSRPACERSTTPERAARGYGPPRRRRQGRSYDYDEWACSLQYFKNAVEDQIWPAPGQKILIALSHACSRAPAAAHQPPLTSLLPNNLKRLHARLVAKESAVCGGYRAPRLAHRATSKHQLSQNPKRFRWRAQSAATLRGNSCQVRGALSPAFCEEIPVQVGEWAWSDWKGQRHQRTVARLPGHDS